MMIRAVETWGDPKEEEGTHPSSNSHDDSPNRLDSPGHSQRKKRAWTPITASGKPVPSGPVNSETTLTALLPQT